MRRVRSRGPGPANDRWLALRETPFDLVSKTVPKVKGPCRRGPLSSCGSTEAPIGIEPMMEVLQFSSALCVPSHLFLRLPIR